MERGEHSVKAARWHRERQLEEEKHTGRGGEGEKGFRCAPDELDLLVSWLTLLM